MVGVGSGGQRVVHRGHGVGVGHGHHPPAQIGADHDVGVAVGHAALHLGAARLDLQGGHVQPEPSQRHLHANRIKQLAAPRPGGGHHRGGVDVAGVGGHPGHRPRSGPQRRHPDAAQEPGPVDLGRGQPAQHHPGDVDVAAVGLVGPAGQAVGHQQRLDGGDLIRGHEPGVDAATLAQLDVAAQGVDLVLGHQQQVAEPGVAGIADPDLVPPAVDHLEAAPGHPHQQLVGVVLADLPEGAAGDAPHRRALVDHRHPGPGPG